MEEMTEEVTKGFFELCGSLFAPFLCFLDVVGNDSYIGNEMKSLLQCKMRQLGYGLPTLIITGASPLNLFFWKFLSN